MKVGFTGTRKGMAPQQMDTFASIVYEIVDFKEFHHGDCLGADDEAATIVSGLKAKGGPPIRIFCHPPIDEAHRAFNKHYDEILPAKTHFARNRDIVDATDMIIACPCDMSPQARGGTWYTVNYAQKTNKTVRIVWPDGRQQIIVWR